MDDACYLCRRRQVDLDHLNEEVRTKVYLSYFSNIRAQVDELRRRTTFLQRLRDEEGSDPHFRIGAAQVFGDPAAYKKLMPWIDSLIEIARSAPGPAEVSGTIGELVDRLLEQVKMVATRTEEGLNRIREGFATDSHSPLKLEPVVLTYPVGWSVDGSGVAWKGGAPHENEPLHRPPGSSLPTVEIPLNLCTACRKLLRGE